MALDLALDLVITIMSGHMTIVIISLPLDLVEKVAFVWPQHVHRQYNYVARRTTIPVAII